MTGQQNIASAKTGTALPPAPCAGTRARKVEKKIIKILRKLIMLSPPSCIEGKFRAEYERAMVLFSQFQQAMLVDYPLKTTCGPRCGACCCHWPEDAYSFEVLYIAECLKRRRKDEIPAMIKRLRGDITCLERIRASVEKRFTEPGKRATLGEIDPYDLVLSSFYNFKRSCPLLASDGSCSIHPIRPLTCRVYVSFSPREFCSPERIGSDAALTYLLDLEQDASGLFDQLHFMYDIFDGDTGFRSMLCKALET